MPRPVFLYVYDLKLCLHNLCYSIKGFEQSIKIVFPKTNYHIIFFSKQFMSVNLSIPGMIFFLPKTYFILQRKYGKVRHTKIFFSMCYVLCLSTHRNRSTSAYPRIQRAIISFYLDTQKTCIFSVENSIW